MSSDPPAASEFKKLVMGPSGNLRAPALRLGKTWVIGYSDEMYERVFR